MIHSFQLHVGDNFTSNKDSILLTWEMTQNFNCLSLFKVLRKPLVFGHDFSCSVWQIVALLVKEFTRCPRHYAALWIMTCEGYTKGGKGYSKGGKGYSKGGNMEV